MTLHDKVLHRLQALDDAGLRRRLSVVDTPCGPYARVDGRELLAFCSNDYLGLAAHPQIIQALQEGAALYGAGSGASHMISGHSRAHALLEDRLSALYAPFIDQARALYFSTGYMANLALLTGLAQADDSVEFFSEGLNHASLIDGMRLARVPVQVYPHGDVEQLEQMLKESTASTRIIVTDSVFSMDGNLAPLRQLDALAQAYDACLVIDDAHGFGVLGHQGLGALEHLDLRSPRVVYMGTLGKAAGVSGAFVVAHAHITEWLVQRARPYIYTTASSPAVAHALMTSLDILTADEGRERRETLASNVRRLRELLYLQKWSVPPTDTAIQPVIIGANAAAMQVSSFLLTQGLWVPAIRPPTVPPDTARLRVTLSAAHDIDDVSRLARALNRAEREFYDYESY